MDRQLFSHEHPRLASNYSTPAAAPAEPMSVGKSRMGVGAGHRVAIRHDSGFIGSYGNGSTGNARPSERSIIHNRVRAYEREHGHQQSTHSSAGYDFSSSDRDRSHAMEESTRISQAGNGNVGAYSSTGSTHSSNNSNDSNTDGASGACRGEASAYYSHTSAGRQGAEDSAVTALSGNNGENSKNIISAYSHVRMPMVNVNSSISKPGGPAIQAGQHLHNDYSRRVHCYISDGQDNDHSVRLASESTLPPVLPLLSSLSTQQELPFWRPPRVLQRDPHYNRPAVDIGTSMASYTVPNRQEMSKSEQGHHRIQSQYHHHHHHQQYQHQHQQYGRQQPYQQRQQQQQQQQQQHSYQHEPRRGEPQERPTNNGSVATSPSSLPPGNAKSSLSSALLAISNTHYKQQQQQQQQQHHLDMEGKNTLPPIQSFSARRDSEDDDADASLSSPGTASTGASPSVPSPAALSHRHLQLAPIGTPMVECRSTGGRESMSIACLVDAQESSDMRLPGVSGMSRKRSSGAAEAALSLHKLARTGLSAEVVMARSNRGNGSTCGSDTVITYSSVREEPGLCAGNQVVITCYHAAVAQKSYGGEKRFLCPPPAVLMCGEGSSARTAHGSAMVLSVVKEAGDAAVVRCGDPRPSSSAHAPLECQTSFNERNVALFKSLHVTGMQKAKSFRLRLDLLDTTPSAAGNGGSNSATGATPYASLESGAVAIISKPSKKTAKARNQSTCIRGGALVSLFNRINSQTFRTKYLNVDHQSNRWVAQSHNWSPFSVEIAGKPAGAALYYGSEIVLVESHRNFRSPPMIIRKVERGRLVPGASSPVSQMQKIALQLKQSDPASPPSFLLADAGHYNPGAGDSNTRFEDSDSSPELTFEAVDTGRMGRSRARETAQDGAGQELDDAFCWTIVGISAFTYCYSVPRDQAVGAMPRTTSASLESDGTLRMVTPGANLCADTLLLGSQALHATAADGEDAFCVQLPENAGAGALAIRRGDGALFHTGWAMRPSAGTGKLELVECSLDI